MKVIRTDVDVYADDEIGGKRKIKRYNTIYSIILFYYISSQSQYFVNLTSEIYFNINEQKKNCDSDVM